MGEGRGADICVYRVVWQRAARVRACVVAYMFLGPAVALDVLSSMLDEDSTRVLFSFAITDVSHAAVAAGPPIRSFGILGLVLSVFLMNHGNVYLYAIAYFSFFCVVLLWR